MPNGIGTKSRILDFSPASPRLSRGRAITLCVRKIGTIPTLRQAQGK